MCHRPTVIEQVAVAAQVATIDVSSGGSRMHFLQ